MIDDIKQWFRDIYQDMIDWFKDLAVDVVAEIKDLALDLFEALISGTVLAIGTIAPPEVLATSLNTISAGMPPALLYFLSQTGLAEGFSIIGSAVMFRIARKIYTLGAW
jgi:hypothetical protein